MIAVISLRIPFFKKEFSSCPANQFCFQKLSRNGPGTDEQNPFPCNQIELSYLALGVVLQGLADGSKVDLSGKNAQEPLVGGPDGLRNHHNTRLQSLIPMGWSDSVLVCLRSRKPFSR